MSRKIGTKLYEEVRDHDDPDRVYESFVFCASLNIVIMVEVKQAQIMAKEYKRLKEIEIGFNALMAKRMSVVGKANERMKKDNS